jgi:hypothetical protein
MDKAQLQTWVLRKLGAPLLTVELHPADLEDAFEDAVDWFIAKKGVVRSAHMEVSAGQVAYAPPEDLDVLIDVVLPASPYDFSLVFSPYLLAGYEKVPWDVFAAPESAGLYSSLTQAFQYTDTAKRVLSSDFNYMWDEARRLIILSPQPHISGTMVVSYKSNSLTPEQLSAFDHDMFKRRMLAEAKHKLGTTRSKYGGFPGAQGERSLDGADLKSEAKEELEALNEEIARSSFPVPFIKG